MGLIHGYSAFLNYAILRTKLNKLNVASSNLVARFVAIRQFEDEFSVNISYTAGMVSIAILLAALMAQEPTVLEVGKPFEGKVTDSAALVHSPILDSGGFSDTPTLGVPLIVTVAESGVYFLELRSFDFDAYLILRDASGRPLAEDDDSSLGTHARIVFELDADYEYQVSVCALHGSRGAYEVNLNRGVPENLSRVERDREEILNAQRRIEHLKLAKGADSVELVTALNALALLLYSQGDYEKALPLYERSLALTKKVLGPDHLKMAQGLHDFAILHQAQGNFEEARTSYEQSLAILEKLSGPDHLGVAKVLNSLANLYESNSKYEKASPLYERSLAIWEKVLGPDHPNVAIVLDSLAVILTVQGNYEEARPLFDRSLSIWEKVVGPNHPRIAQCLNNIAQLLRQQGNYKESQLLYERALAIAERMLGPDHPNTATGLANLADLLQLKGDFEEARPLYERSLMIREKVLGPFHPDIATGLNNFALLLRKLEEHEKAQPLYERSLAINEELYGPEHPDVATSLNNLAGLLQAQGNHEEARPLYERSLASSLQFLNRELPTLNEAGRLRLLEINANPESLLYSLWKLPPSSYAPYYSLFQNWKGKATRLQYAGLRLIQTKSNPEFLSKKRHIQDVAKNLSNLVFLPLSNQDSHHKERISDLRKERVRLERELNHEFGLDLVMATPSLEVVQSSMPANSVLLDFFVGIGIFVWVLPPSGDPQLIPLGDAGALRAAQEAFLRGRAIRGGRTLTDQSTVQKSDILSLLWAPLRDSVGEASIVFVSPDGFLGELPFGIMEENDGDFLLEKHRFVYLSDSTSLAGKESPNQAVKGSLFAVGDVNYFQRDDVAKSIAAEPSTRSRIGDAWNSLPATRDELQALRDLHNYILEWDSPLTVLEGKAATEERIRAELPGKRYVHIATHGYFEPDHLPSLMLDAEEKQAKAQLGELIQAVGLLPGLLSGLVFAGVNGEHDPTRDDGFLSAEEIQHLDLSACDLVVLSACETALGCARAGEGLMSVRRAFSVAGADTVISSLWKVDDKSTAQLMKDFYTNLWEKGMGRGEALHEAKVRMLRRSRLDNGGDAKPSTWGAFVLSGDWN